ncbi:MAG: hypothetical protein OER96_10795 [Gammaproteobacteria bacterium]|nr:hypothetical protein [Gammaproteobacteria bacterium]
MQDILSRPEVQGALPFVVALVVGLLLKPTGAVWSGAGMIAGFIMGVLLVNGLQFEPMTAARKTIVCGVAAAVIGAFFSSGKKAGKLVVVLLIAVSIAAYAWVFWTLLKRVEGGKMIMLVGGGVYTCWLVAALHGLRKEPLQAGAACVALAAGSGIAVILGTSALLGQLALTVAAASGAILLLALIWSDLRIEPVMTYPVALISGLLGTGGMVLAKLPWIALLILAFVPLAARIPLPDGYPRILKVILWTGAAVVVAALAILSVWLLMEESGY